MSSSPTSPSRPLDSSFTDTEAEKALDVNRVLRALAHRRRREVLSLLDEEMGWTRSELTERLLDLQDGPGDHSETEIETALVHTHLPMLEQADLVALEEDARFIQRGESYDIVREMADAAASITVDE